MLARAIAVAPLVGLAALFGYLAWRLRGDAPEIAPVAEIACAVCALSAAAVWWEAGRI